jgi:CDP-glucose 4,6-dehydratase
VGYRKSALEILGMNPAIVDSNFWHNRKVLVTGHTGFKGSWLSLWLQAMGAEVHGFALPPPTTPSLFHEANVADGMRSEIGDIRDLENLTAIFRKFEPEIVIHMAAQPLVRQSYSEPVDTYSTNVMGTVNVLEATRQSSSVRSVVNVTTDKCYENREWVWGYREDEPMGGYDPYSSSKGCAELVTEAYRRSFFADSQVAVASARAGNVIGGGDWAADRLVPDTIKAFEAGRAVTLRNPNSTRPWQHVLEPLSGYLVLAQHLFIKGQAYAEPWNFGPQDADAKPVQWIVEKLAQEWGDEASWEVDSANHPHEANYLKLDCSKAHQRLQWMPRWDLHHALVRIVQWNKAWSSGTSARSLCEREIADFMGARPL